MIYKPTILSLSLISLSTIAMDPPLIPVAKKRQVIKIEADSQEIDAVSLYITRDMTVLDVKKIIRDKRRIPIEHQSLHPKASSWKHLFNPDYRERCLEDNEAIQPVTKRYHTNSFLLCLILRTVSAEN